MLAKLEIDAVRKHQWRYRHAKMDNDSLTHLPTVIAGKAGQKPWVF